MNAKKIYKNSFKALNILLLFLLVLCLTITLSSCGKNKKNSESSSKKTYSYVPKANTSTKSYISGNNVIYKSETGESKILITYKFSGDVLKSAEVEQTFGTAELAKSSCETCIGQNKYASQELFKNIRSSGKKFYCEITEFGLQQYKGLTKEELCERLDTEIPIR